MSDLLTPSRLSIKDRDNNNFRESPEHGQNHPARAVVVENDSTGPVIVSAQGPTQATVQNISLAVNTEYELTIDALTKFITLQARGLAKIQISFVMNQTDTNYFTISPGQTFDKAIGPGFQNIYLRLKNHSDTIEVIEWK
jgi:hypothetical protein